MVLFLINVSALIFVFSAKNQKLSNVGKIRNYDEGKVFFREKNVLIILKAFIQKWEGAKFSVVAGRRDLFNIRDRYLKLKRLSSFQRIDRRFFWLPVLDHGPLNVFPHKYQFLYARSFENFWELIWT